jgi:transposase
VGKQHLDLLAQPSRRAAFPGFSDPSRYITCALVNGARHLSRRRVRTASGFERSGGRRRQQPGGLPTIRDLLKLYVYGYLNEVRSSRRLERECARNVEAMWLLRRLAPDFKTIADFRRDNGTAIVGTCRALVLFCRDQSLFTGRLVALDGSKFRAAASTRRVMGRREFAEEASRLDRRIAEYLAGLDASDAREPDEAPNATAAALQVLKSRRAELDRLAAKLDAEERATLVDGELDARPMGIGKGPKPSSYNVQTAVDADRPHRLP